jgi:2-hydroxy-3-keto-5-methylthiopentenyl-1-phosphate phosphatase
MPAPPRSGRGDATDAAAGRAPTVGPLADGAVPLAILVDYDGTIALTDVSDAVMAEHATDSGEQMAARYDAGLIGSRRFWDWETNLIRAEGDALLATAARQPHDPGFVPFVRRAQAAGIPVEVVSDGLGFFIAPAMERLGLPELPIVTARTSFAGGRATISYPSGHPSCRVCGTCKRQRVQAHQAAGRAVVFIGDGESDRYAAGYADIVFAKRLLVPICVANGWPFEPWTEFAEIHAWLNATLDVWRRDPATSLVPRPTARPFFCGPEVWGDDVEDPPAPGVSAS